VLWCRQIFSSLQATLSSELMSTVVAMNCWDLLLTAAAACCVQLLHDSNEGVYMAVGCTLHGFTELERILLSLLSMSSCQVIDTGDMIQLTASSTAAVSSSPRCVELSSDSAVCEDTSATDAEQRLPTSTCSDTVTTSVATTGVATPTSVSVEEGGRETVLTRSGRPVKPKNFADFQSSLQTDVRRVETVRRQRGRQRPPISDVGEGHVTSEELVSTETPPSTESHETSSADTEQGTVVQTVCERDCRVS